MHQDVILDAAEVAEHLRCSVEQAEALMREDELPATKVGRGWITTYGEVVRFVTDRIRRQKSKPLGYKASVSEPRRGKRRELVPLPTL